MSTPDIFQPSAALDPSFQGPVTGAGYNPDDQVASPNENDTNPNGSEAPHEDEEMADLFGDEDNEEKPVERQGTSPTPSLPGSDISAERRRRQVLEYGEDEAEPEPEIVQLREAAVSVPNIPVPNPTDHNHWIIRFPNFVNVDTKPFDPDTYIGPDGDLDEPSSGLNMREQSMSIKLQVENTIRWRWVKGSNGEQRRQSNSRIIRWSDGTMSLQLGNELFEVSPNVDTPSQPAASSQTPITNRPNGSNSRSQGLTYLVAQHKRAEILQAEAVINGSLSIRPLGMQSATHRKLVRAVGQRHQKATRLIIAPDPTKESEMERAELLKTQKKTSSKRRRAGADDSDLDGKRVGRRSSTGGARRKRQDIWSDDEDDASDDGNATRYNRQPGTRLAAATPSKTKGSGEYEADEFVVDDESEEGDDQEAQEEDAGQDSLEEADEAIERATQARKSGKKTKRPGADDGEPSLSPRQGRGAAAESDNEDEGAIRRAGTGSRKARRAVAADDSEEE